MLDKEFKRFVYKNIIFKYLPGQSHAGLEEYSLVVDNALFVILPKGELDNKRTFPIPVKEFFYNKLINDEFKAKKRRRSGPIYHCCNKVMKNNIRLMSHLRHKVERKWKESDEETGNTSRCGHCYRHFDDPQSLQQHVDTVHAAKVETSCLICERFFSTAASFLDHMRKHHVMGDKPYFCKSCDARSSFYSDIIEHFKEHHKDTSHFLCSFCLLVCKTEKSFKTHMLKHEHKNLACPRCRLQFLNDIELKKHLSKAHECLDYLNTNCTSKNSSDYYLIVVYLPNSSLQPLLKQEVMIKNNLVGLRDPNTDTLLSGPTFGELLSKDLENEPPIMRPRSSDSVVTANNSLSDEVHQEVDIEDVPNSCIQLDKEHAHIYNQLLSLFPKEKCSEREESKNYSVYWDGENYFVKED